MDISHINSSNGLSNQYSQLKKRDLDEIRAKTAQNSDAKEILNNSNKRADKVSANNRENRMEKSEDVVEIRQKSDVVETKAVEQVEETDRRRGPDTDNIINLVG